MEILKFIKWIWSRQTEATRAITTVVTSVLSLVMTGIFFGPLSMLMLLASLCLLVVLYWVGILIHYIYRQWLKFKKLRQAEQEMVVDVLAGKIDQYTAKYKLEELLRAK